MEGLLELEHALVASVRLARSEPELLAREASETYGYPPGFLARYFEKLRYSFGPRERAGLYTFLEMARDVGELDHVPELRFVREEVARVTVTAEPTPGRRRGARQGSRRGADLGRRRDRAPPLARPRRGRAGRERDPQTG